MALVNVSPLSFSAPALPPPSSSALLPLRPTRLLFTANSSLRKNALSAANGNFRTTDAVEDAAGENDAAAENAIFAADETRLYSVAPLPLLFLAGIPGAATVRSVFAPFVEIVKSLDLPDWLVHWGHPANMAVVLFAMGGYGTYLGFRIRFSDDVEEKANAKDLHPKLLGGMFFFFALGATGGVTSLLTSDKPIFESPHAVTGIIGLLLLSTQSALPALFEGNPGLRSIHGILGSGIMALFLVHAALGLQLGLSS